MWMSPTLFSQPPGPNLEGALLPGGGREVFERAPLASEDRPSRPSRSFLFLINALAALVGGADGRLADESVNTGPVRPGHAKQ